LCDSELGLIYVDFPVCLDDNGALLDMMALAVSVALGLYSTDLLNAALAFKSLISELIFVNCSWTHY
jgi:exosome complex RNA-binding protein Rrp42 (RNase PH superfamily)